MARKKKSLEEALVPTDKTSEESPQIEIKVRPGVIEALSKVPDARKIMIGSVLVLVLLSPIIASIAFKVLPTEASPPMPPTLVSVVENTPEVQAVLVDPIEAYLEDLGPVTEPFTCSYFIGRWTDEIARDAASRGCDVIPLDYFDDRVFYYDIDFKVFTDLTPVYY